LEYVGVDVRKILQMIIRKPWEDVERIRLAQDKDQWQVFPSMAVLLYLCVDWRILAKYG
jgi:hypothetical protein